MIPCKRVKRTHLSPSSAKLCRCISCKAANIRAHKGYTKQLKVKQFRNGKSQKFPGGIIIARPMKRKLPRAEKRAPRQHKRLHFLHNLHHRLMCHKRRSKSVQIVKIVFINFSALNIPQNEPIRPRIMISISRNALILNSNLRDIKRQRLKLIFRSKVDRVNRLFLLIAGYLI